MNLLMVVSPATWDLIERIRPELDVFVDVFDLTLAPLLPEASHHVARALRAAIEDNRGRDWLRSVIDSGRHAVFASEELRIGLFPVRHQRGVIGVLAAAAPSRPVDGDATPTGTGLPADIADRRIERIGWTLRTSLEADIAASERLDRAQHHARWTDGVLRFLSFLHTCSSEAELFEAIVQAAAVWGDLDARVYRRTPCGRYVVDVALPSAPHFDGPESLDAALVDARGMPLHVTSVAEMEQLGWSATTGGITLMPLGAPRRPAPWLLAIAGHADDHLSMAFDVLARTAAVRLDELLLARLERLGDRLRRGLCGTPTSVPATVPATTARLLREFSVALPAGQARLLVADAGSGLPRPIASVGVELFGPTTVWPSLQRMVTAERLVFPLAIDAAMAVALELSAPIGRPFSLADAALAERATRWIEAWLAGAWRGLTGARAAFAAFVTAAPSPLEDPADRTPANAW